MKGASIRNFKDAAVQYRTRGRVEVLGQAGVAEACAYTLEGVSKNQKSTNSSNSTALLVPIFSPSSEYVYLYLALVSENRTIATQSPS